jgi:hypothetical protein
MSFIIESNILYCDLDGVLVDFEQGVQNKLGKNPDELNKNMMWATLRKSPNFYDKLPWMPKGRSLWEAIKEYNPVILTGCPRGGWSEEDKRSWCKRELGPNIKVICCETREKPNYCSEGDILIDDRDMIMDEWIKKGGKYVLYSESNLESNIEIIKKYFE